MVYPAACEQVLSADPLSGAMFVFRNRSGTSIKCINYDGNGFWLAKKDFQVVV